MCELLLLTVHYLNYYWQPVAPRLWIINEATYKCLYLFCFIRNTQNVANIFHAESHLATTISYVALWWRPLFFLQGACSCFGSNLQTNFLRSPLSSIVLELWTVVRLWQIVACWPVSQEPWLSDQNKDIIWHCKDTSIQNRAIYIYIWQVKI